MSLRQNAVYDLVVPTSMGVRITPADRQPVHISTDFKLQATSAESNVLNISASLGLRTKVLTAFVAESPIARFIQGDLRRRNIEYEGREVPQGGPWGYRHQFNIADSGFGARGPRVHNDRAGEVGLTISADDFDLDRLFRTEGVRVLHMSGLFAALSPGTASFCRTLARLAHETGTVISFDLNYRASFWAGREAELSEAFAEIASLSDVLIGNEEDFQLALGMAGPESGGKNVSATDSFRAMILEVKRRFPNAAVFATTLRQVLSANAHLWGALLLDGETWHRVEPREIQVLDRIGGGDGFVGGLLYGVLRGWDAEKCLQFGWASGALVTTLLTDYGEPADEDVIWSIWNGNARVKR
ncbi:MAG: sugar kinase [Oscillospiraceae bacterium]|nr:sugar kinase [Oscillospiraceae bacterium]